MFYRIFIVLLALTCAFTLYRLYYWHSTFSMVLAPDAGFLVRGPDDSPITVTEFIDYNCPHCREVQPAVKDALRIRKDIRYVARPVPFLGEDSERLTRLALAAGLQDKFWEFHEAFLTYPEDKDESFIRQTAAVYNIDYDRMIADSGSDIVDGFIDDNMEAAVRTDSLTTPSFVIGRILYAPQDKLPETSDILQVISAAQKEN